MRRNDAGALAAPVEVQLDGMNSLDNNGVDRDTYFHRVTNGFRRIVLLRPAPTVLDYRLRTWDLAGQLVSDLALEARRIDADTRSFRRPGWTRSRSSRRMAKAAGR